MQPYQRNHSTQGHRRMPPQAGNLCSKHCHALILQVHGSTLALSTQVLNHEIEDRLILKARWHAYGIYDELSDRGRRAAMFVVVNIGIPSSTVALGESAYGGWTGRWAAWMCAAGVQYKEHCNRWLKVARDIG